MKTDNDNIKLDILTERPAVRKDEASELDIVIEIHTKQPTEAIEDPKKLNLCVVIDRSGSMSGDKLEAAKRSCIDIYKRLSDGDLFTVVRFNDEAEVVVNPQTPKTKVIEEINSISSNGATNLSLGWYLGLLELQTYMTENHNNRLFLLSDGQANQGETKKTILEKEASRSREDLKVTTSTIGIGNDFQEELLDAIATKSGGRFWYIQESQIGDIMEAEFKGALSVIIDRPRIELKLPGTGVTVSKELNAVKKSSGKYCPRPIRGESRFNFAVRLEIMPEAIKGDQFTLEATLSNGEKTLLSTQKTVSLQSFQECIVSESNPIVKSVVEQYKVTETNEEVIEKMSDGSLDLVKKMLVTEVEGMHKAKDALEENKTKERESERTREELAYFGSELQYKETSLLFAETFENFVGTIEVQDFLRRWRKVFHRDQHRMIQRENAFSGDFDENLQVALLTSAIDLVEVLMQKFPDKKDELIAHKDRLHAQMARYK